MSEKITCVCGETYFDPACFVYHYQKCGDVARAQGGEAVEVALWDALADCVSCFDCPEWSDKCEEVERRATKLLNSTAPQSEGDGWIKCSERLPTEADGERVWVHDEDAGSTELVSCTCVRGLWNGDKASHWMPTGLKRPTPP